MILNLVSIFEFLNILVKIFNLDFSHFVELKLSTILLISSSFKYLTRDLMLDEILEGSD